MMTIRLTSVENFLKVLEKLKQDPMYDEGTNAMFFKYGVPRIKEGLQEGSDEWYLGVDWLPDSASCKIVMILRYYRRSDIQTDFEYLTEEE